MKSCAQMDPVESHEKGLIPNHRLHVFENKSAVFVFNPLTVQVDQINSDEAKLIKASSVKSTITDLAKSLGWKENHIFYTIDGLKRKGLWNTASTCTAEFQEFCKEVEVLVNVSQVCNLSCEYCFVDKGRFSYKEKTPQKLSPELSANLIKALPAALPWAEEYTIHFYGGEPLLNMPAIRACIEAAEHAGDDRFTFSITTNGTIYNDEIFSILWRGRFNVILSVDGPAAVHNAARRTKAGSPTHHHVLNFLNLLRKGPRLSIRGSSVVRHGWSLKEASEYLKTLPIDLIKAQAVRLSPTHPLSLSRQEHYAYISHIADIAEEVTELIRQNTIPIDDRFNHFVLQLLLKQRRIAFCGAGRWMFGMSAEGTILPCALLAGQEEAELGHINNLQAEWVSRGLEWAESHGPRAECEKCWALPLCGGGCYAMISICGGEECDFIRATCEGALAIYSTFFKNRPQDLLVLAGITED